MRGTGDELVQAVIQAVVRDVTHTVIDVIDGIGDMREGGAR
jgi:hypothetical protein